MKFLVVLTALMAGAQAVEPENLRMRHKSLEEMKNILESIKTNLMSMKPSINLAAGMIDSYAAPHSDSLQTVDQALAQLSEKNIPEKCLQEATARLNEIKEAVSPNCSALHIVEDMGAVMYNTANFAAVSMVTFEDVLNGKEQCGPWYKFWHSLPCAFSYAITSYADITKITIAAFHTWTLNESHVKDITYQVFCKKSQLTLSQPTANQVLNEAYLCSKKLQ